ncbi:MAG: LysR substrate-binding domain-containing protein [Pseudomonadota bacterium]
MLPSLTAIRTFEVAANTLNFARAAKDLGVQPPAVSRQIAELEKSLGTRLFVRSKPRLSLTAEGEELYRSISRGMHEIRTGCQRIHDARNQNSLRVITSIGISSCWLLNRLAGFYQRYPEIDLQLITRDSTTNLDTRDADVSVTFGDANMPGTEVTNIFREKMITVCHPKLLGHRDRFMPEELTKQKLLFYAEPVHRKDWQSLLGSVNIDAPAAVPGATFNSYIVYLQAALSGIGIAIGWEYLLQDHLDDGNLCRASSLRLESDRGYFCCITENGADNPASYSFRDWICSLNR